MARPQEQRHLVTAEEFYAMPESRQAELVEGEVVPVPPVGLTHGNAAGDIYANLKAFVRRAGLGLTAVETGFILSRDPDVVRGPDVSFISAEKLEKARSAEGFVPFAPDLAVEVLSPGDRYVKVQRKVEDYLRAGTRLVWVVDAEARQVVVFAPETPTHICNASDTLTGGDVLPGFAMTVADLLS